MPFRMVCQPAFNYARDTHKTRIFAQGVCFESPSLHLGLATEVPLKTDGKNGVKAEFTLGEEENAIFLLQAMQPASGCGTPLSETAEEELFQGTVNYWRQWLSRCRYKGRWREMVYRSALVLKLLTYHRRGYCCSTHLQFAGAYRWRA